MTSPGAEKIEVTRAQPSEIQGRMGERVRLGAVIYSGLMFVINWSASWWGGRTALEALFGEDLLTPIILYPLVLVVGLMMDIVAVGLTLRIGPKTKRKTNLIICAIALVILTAMLIGPFVAQTIYSARVRG